LNREGCGRRALPERFGNRRAVYTQLNRWAKQTALQRGQPESQRPQALSRNSRIIRLRSGRRRGARSKGR